MNLKHLKIFGAIVLILSLTSCDILQEGMNRNSNQITQEFPLNQTVEVLVVKMGIMVELVRSDYPNIVVTADENLISEFFYEINNRQLLVSSKKAISNPRKMRVQIPHNHVIRIIAYQGSLVTSPHVLEHSGILLSGYSNSKMEFSINAGNVEAYTEEGAEITIRGTSNMLMTKAYTSGVVDADKLETGTCIALAETEGVIYVNVAERLYAETKSNGEIHYRGKVEDVRFTTDKEEVEENNENAESQGNDRRSTKTQPQRRDQENEGDERVRPERDR